MRNSIKDNMSEVAFVDQLLMFPRTFTSGMEETVRVSKRLFSDKRSLFVASILEELDDALVAFDNNWRYIYVNAQGEMLLGKKRQDLIGKELLQVFPDAFKHPVYKALRTAKRKQKPLEHEFYSEDHNKWFLCKINASFQGLTIYFSDITSIKRSEQEVRKKVRQQQVVSYLGQKALLGCTLSDLFNEATGQVADVLDVEYTKVLELLKSGKAFVFRSGVGWQKKIIFGESTLSVANSQAGFALLTGKPVIVKNLRRETRFGVPPLFIEQKIASGMSVIIQGRDKPFGVLSVHTKKMRDFSDADIHFLLSVANVLATAIDQRRILVKLRENEERYRIVVENATDIITVISPEGNFVYLSPSYKNVLGYSPKELYGKEVMSFVHPDDVNHVTEELTKALAKPGIRKDTFRLLHKKGHYVLFEAAGKAIFNENGIPEMVVSTLHDATERMEKEKRKDEFISLASHELKTPITSMMLFVDVLERHVTKTDKEKSVRVVQRIKDQIEKLNTLVSDLLDVSRIQTGKLRFHKETFYLDVLVDETIEGTAALLNGRKITYLHPRNISVHADRFRLYQVLTNLLTNAIKYSPPDSEITVNVEKKGQEAQISVQDKGIGIDEEHKERIFQKLYQVSDPEQKTYPGLGMGLYISKEIIDRHGGKIWVESEKGKGSTFFVRLTISK